MSEDDDADPEDTADGATALDGLSPGTGRSGAGGDGDRDGATGDDGGLSVPALAVLVVAGVPLLAVLAVTGLLATGSLFEDPCDCTDRGILPPLGHAQCIVPVSDQTYDFEYDAGNRRLTVTYADGERMWGNETERLLVVGSASEELANVTSFPVRNGDVVARSVSVHSGETVRVVWVGAGRRSTTTVASFEVP